MGFSFIDFFIMLSIVAIIAWFATKKRRKKTHHIEERALLPEGLIYTNSSPLLKIPPATQGETPFFLCLDTETVELIPKTLSEENRSEIQAIPPIVALSYNLLSSHGHCIFSGSELILSSAPISDEATKLHGITEEIRSRKGVAPHEAYKRFQNAFDQCQVVVAHNLASHRAILDADLERYHLAPLPWERKRSFCTMEHGYSYLMGRDPQYIGAYPSLRLLYSKLYYDRYDMHFVESDKSMADLLLVSACLSFLYPT